MFQQWRGLDNPTVSIYETIRQHEEEAESEEDDLDEHMTALDNIEGLDDDNLGQPTRARPGQDKPSQREVISAGANGFRPKWMSRRRKMNDAEDPEDDVPASLLIEGDQLGLGPGSIALPPPPSATAGSQPYRSSEATATRQSRRPQPIHPQSLAPRSGLTTSPLAAVDPRSKAMWRWTNVVHLDNFLTDVYIYYMAHGIWSILLRRVFGLLTSAFLVGFSLFLTQCVNYHSGLSHVDKLEQVLVANCTKKMTFFPSLLLWFLVFVWVWKVFQYAMDMSRLKNLHDFYLYLLDINDAELQSISWQEIVSRIMALRDSNPAVAANISAKSRRYAHTQSKQRMDAHDIANRLMRRQNYIIAMVNKEILDFTLPVPFLRNRQLFTRTLEWNLNWCIMDFVFDDRGQVRPTFIRDTHRKELSEELCRRFIFAGTLNLLIAPFLIIFFFIQNFFTHFNEYQKNPGAIGSREYNVLAEWKFREFNELRHLFKRRINMSHPFASRYIDQFPRDKTIQAARFVTFISGAIVSVLGVATIFDQENFLALELTNGRSAIFYIGLFGGIWAVARGMIPEDSLVYEPAFAMQEVIDFTHYQPSHWQNRLHTVDVKREFEQLYQMKILIFVEEILSMVFTPFVLWFSLPKCSDRIIDFFREFTVHVDGIGYVCSFAEFSSKKPLEPQSDGVVRAPGQSQGNEDAREDYFASKDHKLEQSYWGFMNDYARNPKADVRFHYQTQNARKRMNLPPPVPGLPSPTLQGGFGGQSAALRSESVYSPLRGNNGPATPLQSMLLDPHHQPSSSVTATVTARDKSRAMYTSQGPSRAFKSILDRPEQVLEESEGEEPGASDQTNGLQLGSWKYDDDSSSGSADENDEAVPHDGGVIGLVRRLKLQSEGSHGAGI